MSDERSRIGKNLLVIRNELELTREQLAEKCGLSVQTIKEIENGTRDCRASTIIALSKGLGVSSDRLLGLEHSNISATETQLRFLLGDLPAGDLAYLIETIRLYKRRHIPRY